MFYSNAGFRVLLCGFSNFNSRWCAGVMVAQRLLLHVVALKLLVRPSSHSNGAVWMRQETTCTSCRQCLQWVWLFWQNHSMVHSSVLDSLPAILLCMLLAILNYKHHILELGLMHGQLVTSGWCSRFVIDIEQITSQLVCFSCFSRPYVMCFKWSIYHRFLIIINKHAHCKNELYFTCPRLRYVQGMHILKVYFTLWDSLWNWMHMQCGKSM